MIWGASIVILTDVSVDMSVVTRSTFDRYSTNARPTSNQCHYRYSLDIATDIYIYIQEKMRWSLQWYISSTWKWGMIDFPKNSNTKSACRLIIWIIQERLASQPFQILLLRHKSMKNQGISEEKESLMWSVILRRNCLLATGFFLSRFWRESMRKA